MIPTNKAINIDKGQQTWLHVITCNTAVYYAQDPEFKIACSCAALQLPRTQEVFLHVRPYYCFFAHTDSTNSPAPPWPEKKEEFQTPSLCNYPGGHIVKMKIFFILKPFHAPQPRKQDKFVCQ